MTPSTGWHPFFCVLPRKVQGRWCMLQFVQRRLVLEQIGPLRFRYVEEFELTDWPCPPATK